MNPASLSADPEPIPTPGAALPETPDMAALLAHGEQVARLADRLFAVLASLHGGLGPPTARSRPPARHRAGRRTQRAS